MSAPNNISQMSDRELRKLELEIARSSSRRALCRRLRRPVVQPPGLRSESQLLLLEGQALVHVSCDVVVLVQSLR